MLRKLFKQARKNEQQGFSLAEILVSVGLLVLLGAAITTTAITLSSSTSDFTKASTTQNEAAQAVSEMTRDVSAATAITTAQDYRISMQTQEDNKKYEVSYFYWNPENSAYVSVPTGVISDQLPDFPAIMQWRKEVGASTGKLTVAAPGYSVFQQDRTLFTYYDDVNATMITPIASNKLANIKRVDFGFSLKVEDRPARIELASGATPRYTSSEPSLSSQSPSKTDGCVAPQLLPTTTIIPRTKYATINWSPVVGANTYTIYRENDNQKTNPMVVAVINDYNVTTYQDDTVEWGETYRYYMVSGCTIGTSPNGEGMTFTVTPKQPTIVNINTKKDLTDTQKLTSESGTNNPLKDEVYTVARGLTNQIAWKPENGALGYIIYRSGVQIARVGPNTTSYQDYARSFGDSTPYTVVAFNAGSNGTGGASTASAPVTLNSPPAKSTITIAKPDTSTDSTNTQNVITVSTRSPNTTGFQVYKVSTSAASADCANVARTESLDFTTNSKTDTVEWGTWTCYVLIGYNDAGPGEWSDNIISKQKPGKFGVYSLSSTSHQRIDTSRPLPGSARCWLANVPDWITCDGLYERGQACCTVLAMFTAEGKANITIAWNSSKNAYGDYSINQDRTETGGTVDQGDDIINASRVYNNGNQAIEFGNQMPGSLFAYNIQAYAANGEARAVNGGPLPHVSRPDIPSFGNINRMSKNGAPWYIRRVTVGEDGVPMARRGTTDNVIYESDTNGYTSGTAGNWGRAIFYTNTFNGPLYGWISVYSRMSRLGVTNYSASVGADLVIQGNGCNPCYSYYADAPENYPSYWAGHSPIYYSGGYASGTTIGGGSTDAVPTPTPPGPPQEGLPDPLIEQCKNIYENDPKFFNEYGCQFGTGIPSAPVDPYLLSMSGTKGRVFWNIVPFTVGYYVYVNYEGGTTQETYVLGGNTNIAEIPFVDGKVNAITVVAKNGVNVSAPSEPFYVNMPGIPQNVKVNTYVGKTANVTWDPVEAVNLYRVTMISNGTQSSYDVTDPEINLTLADSAPGGTVWVQSIKDVGSDDGSPAVSTKSTPAVIAASEAPENFRLVNLTNQTAKLAWDASIGATTYKITGTYTGPTTAVTTIPEITGITATTYDLTSIPYARTVKLNVQAVNPNGVSSKSETLTFDVLPPKPTNVSLTSNDSLGKTAATPSTVAWTQASCAVGKPYYKLTRVAPNTTVIRDYGNTNFIPIAATGGAETTYTQNGITYKAHTFTANGTFTVTNAGNNGAKVDYLIVGGGGSGGQRLSGGGGAGGVLQGSTTVTATAYPVVVGAGGRAAGLHELGFAGSPSSALGLTAAGGGGGGGYNGSAYVNGAAGGSGGGGGAASSGGAGTAGQGFQGGNGNIQNWSAGGGTGDSGYAGGGGGGAGGPGTAGNGGGPTFGYPGFGGPGIMSNITGTDKWYAGGGGGQQYYNTNTIANGGSGVGGRGASQVHLNIAATAGAPNTGSGGGAGGHYANEGGVSGAGGSGIVVIRYATSDPTQYAYAPYIPLQATGGTVTESSSGGVTYRTHTFYTTSTSDGSSFRVSSLGTSNGRVSVLVVAGGGGGGMDMGGGGGGGGVVYNASVPVYVGTIPVYVGKGGFGAEAGSTAVNPTAHQYKVSARQGDNSYFGTSVGAVGGGAGGSSYFQYSPGASGGAGGSGGGASGYSDGGTRAGGAGVAGQGYNGGQGGGQYYSGGGGGAGGAGTNSPAQPHGGPGIRYADMSPYYFGGGGGGSSYTLATGGNGGIGGGGGGALGSTSGGGSAINTGQAGGGGGPNSWANTPGGNGGANTGGGGGGGSHYNANNQGGDGGSGIVMVKYEISNTSATMHLPGVAYTYKLEVKCVEGNFTSELNTVEHSFTPQGNATVAPSSAPTVNTPGTPISASGGATSTYTSGGITYRVHRFTGSGTFSVSSIGTTSGKVDYLIVGGGGGGGMGNVNEGGGGGGAGGYKEGTTTVTAGSNYTITVGGGGSPAPNTSTNGGNGGASSAFGFTMNGGGAGGSCAVGSGNSGASGGGGGGCGVGRPGGSGTTGQGFGGGLGQWTGSNDPENGNNGNGGGGGGAGGAGESGALRSPFMSTAAGSIGGAGAGKVSTITGSSVTYAQGGNGGAGRSNHTGATGAANTGQGGGGSAADQAAGWGAAGVVIVRYAISTDTPYANTAQKVNVTSTGQCNALHYGTTPIYNYYRNGVKFASTSSTSAVSTDTSGNAGDVVTYEYTVQCQGTLNGANYITPESPKSPVRTVTLQSNIVTATGGTVSTYTSGGLTYKVHRFDGSGTFNVTATSFEGARVEALIVAGGGSGGGRHGGGGGGGGVIQQVVDGINTGSYTITVGGGGTAVSSADARGNNGGNSSAFGLTAIGGGGGGSWDVSRNGSAGGSGGGASWYQWQVGSAGTYGQGQRGGYSNSPGCGCGQAGGGGGAATAGGNARDHVSGAGGAGVPSDILGTTYYFGGGGGAGSWQSTTSARAGNGGIGGGGGGGVANTTGVVGTGGGSALNTGGTGVASFSAPQGGSGGANTGGGGGGAGANPPNGGYSTTSGAGGSGVVIIRYIVP